MTTLKQLKKGNSGLIWLVGTLLLYAALLYLMASYEIPSLIYHTLLLAYPLWLLRTRANIRLLGLVKGKVWAGLSLAIGIIALQMIISWRQWGLVLPTLNIIMVKTVIYSPVTEELFFRGYLQPALEEKFGRWPGLLMTAALFMVVHLPKVLLTGLASPIDLVTLFALGVVFGFIRDISKSVYYPMLCHAGYNFAATLIAP